MQLTLKDFCIKVNAENINIYFEYFIRELDVIEQSNIIIKLSCWNFEFRDIRQSLISSFLLVPDVFY